MYIKRSIAVLIFISILFICPAQKKDSVFKMYGDVKITLDAPQKYLSRKETLVILYALPNGNTTEQTMGKKMAEGDDWHFDIQHLKAQTKFIRNELPHKNVVVAYLENNFKSWPLWKIKHADYIKETQHIVDTIFSLFKGRKLLCLSSHSGGGRFVFNYLDGLIQIPKYVTNISFLDSDYGYDYTYLQKITIWLQRNKHAHLNVFAYNDSVALLNGKRFVSDTGGTWYRSHLMLNDLSKYFSFSKFRDDSIIVYRSANSHITFNLKTNPDRQILHTQQVELNGFIHSVLSGTKRESKNYIYFGSRAYESFIE